MSKDSNNNLMKTIFNPINLIRGITIHQKQSSKVNSQLPWPHGPLFFLRRCHRLITVDQRGVKP